MASSAVVGILRVLLTADAAEFEAGVSRAQKAAKGWEKDLASVGRQAKNVGELLTKALTVPIVGLGAGAIKAASDFESSFAGIVKTVDDATDAMGNLSPVGQRLAQGMRDLAKEIPINVNELNRIGEAAGQLGIKSQNILEFTEVMAKLGVTTNLSSDQAATSLARLANIMQMPQSEFGRLGSTIVALGNNLATTEAEITDFGLRIAGAGKLAGMSEADILAIGGAISSVGVQAEAGGTAVQKMLLAMTEAVATGNDDLTVFAKTAGMTAEQFVDAWQTDAAGAFVAFVEGIGAAGTDAFRILDDLGLKNERLKRTILSVAGAGSTLRDSVALGNTEWEKNTALAKEAEQRFKTFESELIKFWNVVRDIGIEIGNTLLPAFRQMLVDLRPLLDSVASLARGFAELSPQSRNAIVALTGIFAAAGPVIWGFGQVATAGATVAGLFKAGGLLASGPHVIRAIGVAAAGAAAPVLAVTSAIAGVTMAVRVGQEAWGLYKDRQEQARLATEQNKSHQLMLAEASRVSGRAITDEAEAFAILRTRSLELQAEQRRVAEETAKVAATTDAATASTTPYADALRQAREQVAGLSAATRVEIDAAIKLGQSTKEIAEAFGLSEAAVTLYKEGLKSATAASKELAAEQAKQAQVMREYYNWLGERQMEAEGAQMAAAEKRAAAERQTNNEIGVSRMEAEAAELARIETEQAAWRAYLNWLGQRRMEVDAAAMSSGAAAGTAVSANMKSALKGLPGVVQSTMQGGGNLGKSIGSMFGKSLFGENSALTKTIGKGVSSMLGKTIGGAIGSVIPGLGTVVGAMAGAGIGKLVGKLFGGGEQKKVEGYRNELIQAAGGMEQLQARAAAAGVSLDRVMKAKKVKDYEAAVKDLNAAIEKHEQNVLAAGALFDEIMTFGAQGLPAAMRPAIDQMIALGLLTDEQVAKLRGMGDAGAINVDQMKADIELFKGSVQSLGPAFQQAQLDQTAGKYINAFERMFAAGADVGGVLYDAREEVGALVAEAMRAGKTLPANMKPWIDELHRAGLLVDENGEKIEDVSDLQYGEAMKTEAEIAQEGWDRILEAIERLIAQINGPLTDAIDGLPTPRTIRFEGEYVAPGMSNPSGGGVTAMAAGGIVTRPTLALVGERGPEAVIPLSDHGDLGGRLQVRVPMVIDGRTFSEALVEYIPGALARRGV